MTNRRHSKKLQKHHYNELQAQVLTTTKRRSSYRCSHNSSFVVILLFSILFPIISGTSPSAYEVLGVSKSSSQDEIKKKYRQLCLKYHPDKNVGMSTVERTKCEEKFKAIQHANSLIGDKDAKQKYDSMSSLNHRLNRQSSSSSYYGDPVQQFFNNYANEMQGHGRGSASSTGRGRRQYSPYASRSRPKRRPAFYVNGVDVSNLFEFSPFSFGQPPTDYSDYNGYQVHHPEVPKSIFVEKVTVPLEDLYVGADRVEFVLTDSLIQRYRAAFRGGIARQIAFQGLFASIPMLLRSSWPVSALCFAVTCHLSLPRPTRLYYHTEIKSGWKGGTKLKFSGIDPDLDVVFILKEGKHERFLREGDDLITSIIIGRSKAENGCSVKIDSLDQNEQPILLKLRKGEVTHDGQIVTIKGQGWPKRNGKGRGDLLVRVDLVSDSKASKIQKKLSSKR